MKRYRELLGRKANKIAENLILRIQRIADGYIQNSQIKMNEKFCTFQKHEMIIDPGYEKL